MNQMALHRIQTQKTQLLMQLYCIWYVTLGLLYVGRVTITVTAVIIEQANFKGKGLLLLLSS